MSGAKKPQAASACSECGAAKQMQNGGQAGADARLCYMKGAECLRAEALWREVFSEDSELFTDYYFRVKAPGNEGFVLEGEGGLRAMLYLTPERLRVFEKEVPSAYIVGVATKEEFRHRGYMARLLGVSFELMYERRVPFVFLMPASAAIYEPFGFRYIYDRPLWDAESLCLDERLRPLGAESVRKIAEFSAAYLENAAAVYIRRDSAYDRVLLEEMAAQEGTIYGFFEKEELAGICLYTCEDGQPDIQEVIAPPDVEKKFVNRVRKGDGSAAAQGMAENAPKTKPCIMARIVHLPAMLELLRAADGEEEISFLLRVHDAQIPENDGIFLCRADGAGCSAARMEDALDTGCAQFFWEGSAAELVQRIFGYGPADSGELACTGLDGEQLWKHLRLLTPVWINEIV